MPKKVYKSRDEVRKNSIVVPVNEAEKTKIKEEAEKRGMTVSAYCRHVMVYGREEL